MHTVLVKFERLRLDNELSELLNRIIQYQKIHSITSKCVINSICYYDIACELSVDKDWIKFKVCHGFLQILNKIIVHAWVKNTITNEIIECSNEYASVVNRVYYESLSELLQNNKNMDIKDKTYLITNLLEIKKIQDTLLDNMCASNQYYRDLQEYVLRPSVYL